MAIVCLVCLIMLENIPACIVKENVLWSLEHLELLVYLITGIKSLCLKGKFEPG